LLERILIPRDGSLGYMRKVQSCLRDNGVVSIRAGRVGHAFVDVALLGGKVRLATGPMSLARATGATLLPVFTVPAGVDSFEVVIEPPIGSRDRVGSDRDVAGVAAQFVGLLESYIVRYPQLWTDWYQGVVDSRRDDPG
jgi:lauroyl/myristoyl acyltransferase